jgi:uncharacterized membrane-anchored protein YjiN (DUF445 family)
VSSTLATPRDEAAQVRALRRARLRATGLLTVVAVAFLGSFALPDTTATGYLRAALEAGLVGGLADWFAVVALFRHPLGVPIPHTAVIPESKEGLGANLAGFVEQHLLDADEARDRLADPRHVERLGAWLEQPANADRVAAQAVGAAAAVVGALDEPVVVDRIVRGVRRRLASLDVSRLAGRSLESAIREHRHDALVTSTIEGLRDTVSRNRVVLRRRLGEQSPAWVPTVVDDLVFDRAEQVVHTFLDQLAREEDHEVRVALDEQLLAATRRMQHDPEVAARVDRALDDVLTDDLLHDWVGGWWREVRTRLDVAARSDGGDGSPRQLVAGALVELGGRLRDPASEVHDRVVRVLDEVAPQVAEASRQEVGAMIESTVERWDAQDASHRLELWLGRDLQFVRINGTVVGAIVGVLLHVVTTTLG